jgi:hypothetical protein
MEDGSGVKKYLVHVVNEELYKKITDIIGP